MRFFAPLEPVTTRLRDCSTATKLSLTAAVLIVLTPGVALAGSWGTAAHGRTTQHPKKFIGGVLNIGNTPILVITSSPTPTPSTATPTPTPTPTSTTPTPTPTPTTTASSGVPSGGCSAAPATCGYPDPSTVGVPAGTPLVASGSFTVSQAGAVISGLKVSGGITIDANNVTVKDTEVASASPDGPAIQIRPGVTGTVVEDSTIHGLGTGSQSLEYAIQNTSDDSAVANRDYLYNCTECFAGGGTLENSYATVNVTEPGAHYEDVYYGGAAGSLTITNDTLLNAQAQTAAVYTSPDFGSVTNVTITNSLLGGGGYTIYGGGDQATNIKVMNNRFSTLYYPNSGSLSTSAYFAYNVPSNVWSGNVWDSNSQPVAHD